MASKNEKIEVELIEDCDINVKVYRVPKPKNEIKGGFLFPILYPVIGLVGKHESGKTNICLNCIEMLSSPKNTKVVFFSRTAHADKLVLKFANDDKRNISVYNNLDNLQEELDEIEDEDDLIDSRKRIVPKKILIFDDIGAELKNKDLVQLFREIRHKNTILIVSCHDFTQIPKEVRAELDFVFVFPGHGEDRFTCFMKEIGIAVSIDKLFKVYQKLLKPHKFLFINTRTSLIRRNFKQRVNIK